MKNFMFIFTIFSSFVVNAQSVKKLNKQLHAELLVEQQKQDSAYRAFLKEQRILGRTQKEVEQYISDSLFDRNERLKELRSSVRWSLSTLKDLEINTKDLFPNGADFDSHPKYSFIKIPIYQVSKKQTKFLVVSEGTSELKGLRLKEQNEVLKEQLKKYQTYAVYNRIYSQEQKDDIRKIEAIHPQVDSLIKVYDSLDSELEQKIELLKKRKDDARENFRVKGPKGFPLTYYTIFPDVHPGPKDERTYDMLVETENYDAVPMPVEIVQEPEVYDVVDEPAYFPGGIEALKKYLVDNLRFPDSAKEKGISGRTFLKFVVSDKGIISDVRVLRGVPDCPECDMEAKRVIKSMPNWIPGKVNGRAVSSHFNLPINFYIE